MNKYLLDAVSKTATQTKPILFLVLWLTITFNLNAAFLQNTPQTLTQPDGSQLECLATGDEFYSWLHDADGYTIMQNPITGFYVYANKIGDELVPTNLIYGTDNPQSLNLQKRLILPENKIKAIRSALEEQIQSKVSFLDNQNQFKKTNKKGEQLQGEVQKRTVNFIVILVRFADGDNFEKDLNYFDKEWNSDSLSAKSYFNEVSYGNFSIPSHFFPKSSNTQIKAFQTQRKRGYLLPKATQNPDGYEGYYQDIGYTREQEIMNEAIKSIKSEIPSDLDLDTDNDGKIDAIAIVFAGKNQNNTPLWPHKAPNWAITETINGKKVGDYNVYPENDCSGAVMVHELFHILGASDLYEYNQINPVSYWDPMGYIASAPPHFSMHTKLKYGKWIPEIPEITQTGTYTINPVTSPTNNSYKICSPYTEKEHFIVEFRKNVAGKFGSGIKYMYPESDGLLIQKIAPDSRGNLYSNDTIPYEVYIYRPGGSKTSAGDIKTAIYSNEYSRTEINDNTNPSSFLHNGSKSGLNISEITKIDDTTMSFKVTIPDYVILVYPENNETYISFFDSLKWKKYGNDVAARLQFATDSNFNNIAYDNNNITGTSFQIPDVLQPLTKYYWRVQPVNSNNWSVVRCFKTSRKNYKTYISDSFEENYETNWDANVITGNWTIKPLQYYQFGPDKVHNAFPFFGNVLIGGTLFYSKSEPNTTTNKVPFNLGNSNKGAVSIMVYRIIPSAKEISDVYQVDKRKDYVSLLISLTPNISQAEEIGKMPILCANEPVATTEGWYDFVAEIPEKYLGKDFYITYKTNFNSGTSKEFGFVYLVMDHLKIIGAFEPTEFEMVLDANPTNGGKVEGAGIYDSNSVITITATENEGFAFSNWVDKNNNIISNDKSLDITIISDTVLTANFNDTVGIKETIIETIKVSPNPTTENITLSFELEKTCNIQILLTDILGKEIMEVYKGLSVEGLFFKTIQTKDLAKGIYLIKILIGDKYIIEKIVVE